MTLKDQIEADASAVFCNADEFAESVTYYPHRYYGEAARDARTITAVVFRQGLSVITEDGDTVSDEWEVHVANDSTTGIASSEIDVGGDQIGLAPRLGKTAERKAIVYIIDHDEGMVTFRCR